MPRDTVVLFTAPSDQGDILQDFLEWHLDLGVDLILAMDHGSTDGSRELLEEYSKTRPVVWYPVEERDIRKYSPADELAALARDRYGADWIIHCDVDEFLCTRGADLRTILARVAKDEITLITVPRRTMTGAPLQPGQRATQALTLRIDRTVEPTPLQQVTWDLPAPFVFLEVGGHLIVRAEAFDRYGAGAHVGTTKWGKTATLDDLYILHYPVRGFDSLETKVRNTISWLDANKHLAPGMCWHWRRWIHLSEQGLLREDYDRQFVSPEQARELVEQGVCAVDESVVGWLAARERNRAGRRGVSKLLDFFSRASPGPFRRTSPSSRAESPNT
jgi:Glycosyl transferase family 2